MRAVVQRVSSACVTVGDGRRRDRPGLLVLLGVERGDGPDDRDYIVTKIRDVRIFPDAADKMNRSVADVGGGCWSCRSSRSAATVARAPAVVRRRGAAGRGEVLYEDAVRALRETGLRVETGEFQAMMQVALVNDGPVTILLDSRRRF